MKLYNSVGPNPKMVRMFLAERNISLETIGKTLSYIIIAGIASVGDVEV